MTSFHVPHPLTASDIASAAGGEWLKRKDTKSFVGMLPLKYATADHVSFLDNKKYTKDLQNSNAGLCLIHKDHIERAPDHMDLIVCDNPYLSFALVMKAFYPPKPLAPGIHETAVIHKTATIDKSCTIGPGVVVGAHVTIGARTCIGAGSVVDDNIIIGNDGVVNPNVTLSCCTLGNHVVIHTGARIGQAGFGFVPDPKGYVKIPHVGSVIIEDHVDIGANVTIDRGTLGPTRIGAGTMIDNLVQIGHNVTIGRGCIIVGQAGIAGSTTLKDFVQVAGQVGIAGHLTIGQGARLAAQSGVMHNIDPGAIVCGTPAVEIGQFMRQVTTLKKMVKKND
jgi:UDP-3-O-[3-hydroxymyristoyl] glucosamine N-acyltransferase